MQIVEELNFLLTGNEIYLLLQRLHLNILLNLKNSSTFNLKLND